MSHDYSCVYCGKQLTLEKSNYIQYLCYNHESKIQYYTAAGKVSSFEYTTMLESVEVNVVLRLISNLAIFTFISINDTFVIRVDGKELYKNYSIEPYYIFPKVLTIIDFAPSNIKTILNKILKIKELYIFR